MCSALSVLSSVPIPLSPNDPITLIPMGDAQMLIIAYHYADGT